MAAKLTFYTNPMSRGRIARWALEEVGAEYDTEVLEYGTTMKAPDYLAINPMGKVPAIKHGDTVVTETAAICCYLADAFPAAGLAPPNDARGDYYRWMFFTAGPLESAVTNQSLSVDVPADKQGFVGYGSFKHVLDAVEQKMSATPFICGDGFTMADLYVGSHLAFGLQFNSIEARPAFSEYVQRVTDREAHRRATALDDAAMAAAT